MTPDERVRQAQDFDAGLETTRQQTHRERRYLATAILVLVAASLLLATCIR